MIATFTHNFSISFATFPHFFDLFVPLFRRFLGEVCHFSSGWGRGGGLMKGRGKKRCLRLWGKDVILIETTVCRPFTSET